MGTNQDKNINNNHEGDPLFRHPKVQNFHTLRSDIINSVKKQDKSVAQVIISAKEKQWAEKMGTSKGPGKVYVENKYKRPKYTLILIGIIVFIGFFAGIRMFVFTGDKATQQKTNYLLELLPITKTLDLDISNLRDTTLIENMISAEEDYVFYAGDILIFNVIDKSKGETPINTLSSKEFTELWAQNIPKDLLLGIGNNQYLTGKYVGETKNTFVVYELTKNEENISLLEEWENTMMEDVGNLFLEQKIPTENVFANATVGESQLVRVLEYTENKPVLVYGFIEDSVLVISDSTDIFIKFLEYKSK